MSSTFYLPPKDRIGYLTLIILFLLISASAMLYQKVFALNESDKLALIEQAFQNHNQTVKAQVKESQVFKEAAETLTSARLATFDPNVADKEQLIAQGFTEYAANNLEKYRNKGGVIKQSSDLYKIYGLDTVTIMEIEGRLILPLSKNEKKIDQKKEKLTIQEPIPVSAMPGEKEKQEQRLEPFDPNTASQKELEKYGLSSYAAKNLKKYITKGGKLEEPEDLKKVYGVDSETYAKVLPYIKIKISESETSNHLPIDDPTSLAKEKEPIVEEVANGIITLNINIATQEELIKISGIGPVISKGIVKYRDMLGGYLDVSQLKEVYGVTEESYEQITQHLFVEGEVKRFYIPGKKFKEVLRHPYIDYETTKIVKSISIMNYAEDFQKLIDDGTIDQRLLSYIYLLDPDLE